MGAHSIAESSWCASRPLRRGLLLAIGCFAAAALAGDPPSPLTPPPDEAEAAGHVDFIDGDVAIVKPDKSRVTPRQGDPVFAGDSVATGASGEVHFAMADGGYIAVRPRTRMRIAQYQANGDDKDRSIIGVLQGSIRVVTGWIGKFNPKGYQVRTAVASVGIRGTDHETWVRQKDDAQGEAGLYDRVYAGATFIQSKDGRVDITPGRAGFHSATHAGPPRVLDRVPAFFKPTRNERLIEGRHARVQSQLQRLRDERRAKRLGAEPAKKGAAAPKKAAPRKGKKAEKRERE
jgi:hypothetical protein